MEIYSDMQKLSEIFYDVQISASRVEVVPASNNGATILRSKNVITVNPDVFNKLKTKVKELRTKYTA